MRGATSESGLASCSAYISTHAPLAGRDFVGHLILAMPVSFQPTRPLRGATKHHDPVAPLFAISTHAPLAGRDYSSDARLLQKAISTHAPLAGRDEIAASLTPNLIEFQPTRPLRGATGFGNQQMTGVMDFNPRAPCGARQQKSTNHYAHFCDNRQISDAFAQNAACQGILLLFDAGKPCGFWVRTAQVISAHLCFAL